MKQRHFTKLITGLLVCMAIAVIVPLPASAIGTLSGTTINNTASALYSVGGVTQPLYTGPTNTFAVDTKVIFNVSKVDGSPVTVSPGDNTSGTTRRLRFQLQNDSNADIRFHVTALDLASGVTITYGVTPYTDNQNTSTTITACFDTNANNVCDVNEDFAVVNHDTLNATIIINGDVPAGATNGQIIGALLTATAVDGGGATLVETAAPTINGVDILLADGAGTNDGARDAIYTDRSSWIVGSALLTITKTAAVYSDPVSGPSTTAKAIPGAVITYTLAVNNAAGGQTATNLILSDSLVTEITSSHVAFQTQFNDGINSCGAAQGIVVNGTCNGNNTGDGDTADWNVTAGDTVTVTGLTIPSPGTATIKFQVVIQ